MQGVAQNIDHGVRESLGEGQSPFLNSKHAGLIVVGMCDGSARTISENIDGIVYSKLITPAGMALPKAYRQFPLDNETY